MCGIWALFGVENAYFRKCECSFNKIKHRGPDASRFEYDQGLKNAFLGFHRLDIINTPFGTQPMRLYQYPEISLLGNEEIYNYQNIKEEFKFRYETGSDAECIVHLFQKFGIEKCVQQLDGVYAFCIIDFNNKNVFIARDPFGVRPLYRMVTVDGILGICSEAKGLIDLVRNFKFKKWTIEQFPPGCYAKYQLAADMKCDLVEEKRFYEIGKRPYFTPWLRYENETDDIKTNIRNLLEAAVEKRMTSDRRIGCFLSGGLDSSLIAAILVKLSKEKKLPYKIQTFVIGMNNDSPDLKAARTVAEYIETEHYEIFFNENDIMEVIDEVIRTIETYDISAVRASICMYLLTRFIKENTDTTVIYSGEGSDELNQGYIYFRDAPSIEEATAENFKRLQEIYLYDGLRADRCTAAHGLELRVPFLDQQFTSYVLNLPRELRRPQNGGIEKYLIRSAFNDTNILPQNILWRPKEEFQDGATNKSRSILDIIKQRVNDKISNDDMAKAASKYPHLTPTSKETYYYREIFEKYYKGLEKTLVPQYWMTNWSNNNDPAPTLLKHYYVKEDEEIKRNNL